MVCSATAFTPPSLVRSDTEAVFMASYDVIRRRGMPSSMSYGGIYPMTWYIICANEFPHPAPPSNILNVEPMWKISLRMTVVHADSADWIPSKLVKRSLSSLLVMTRRDELPSWVRIVRHCRPLNMTPLSGEELCGIVVACPPRLTPRHVESSPLSAQMSNHCLQHASS